MAAGGRADEDLFEQHTGLRAWRSPK